MTHIMTTVTRTVLVLTKSQETAAAIREALGTGRDIRCDVRVGPLRLPAGAASAPPGADVVVVDADLDDDGDILALTALAEGPLAGMPLVVTARQSTIQGMRQLMRLGIADVVPQPIQRPDLLTAIRVAGSRRPHGPTARRDPHEPRRRGGLTVVMKAGGGAGATTIAVHAASALAHAPDSDGGVGLLDLDLQFGTCSLFLDAETKISSLELLEAGRRLDRDMLKSAVVRHRSGLDLLPAPAHVMPLDGIAPDMALRLVETAVNTWDHTVVDMPTPWTAWSRAILDAADCILLVMQMSVPGVHQAARQLETLAAEGLSEKPVVAVVNRSTKSLFGRGDMVRQAERTLGIALDHFIPSEWKAVSGAIDAGATLFETRQAKAFRAAIDGVAKAVQANVARTRARAAVA